MVVTMGKLLPWQPHESFLNDLKSSSKTNKESLSKELFGWWWGGPERWLSLPSSFSSDAFSLVSSSLPSVHS